MDEEPEVFWMVHSRNGPARHRHLTLAEARHEADRLARLHPGEWFYVLEAVSATRRYDLQTVDLRQRDDNDPDGLPFYAFH